MQCARCGAQGSTENDNKHICIKDTSLSTAGPIPGTIKFSTSLGASYFQQPHKIVSVTLTSEGDIEVVRQYPSNIKYGNGNSAPDRVIKEIYRVKDGKIVLFTTVEGKHTPAYMVHEKIEF